MNFDPKFCLNEHDVESKFVVQYLLPELGYTPETWHQEVGFGKIRLDFLVFAKQVLPPIVDVGSSLSLVIEVKHPQQDLNKHVKQIKKYLTKLRVGYGLLTNGHELRVYKRNQENINLIFQCFGKEITTEIGVIKEIIGRDNLQKSYFDYNSASQNQELRPELLKQETLEKQHSMKVIAIYHNKGGVGKTTASVNLAAAFRNQGKRVLLIDIDAQANSTFATGLIKFQFEEDDNLRDCNVFHLLSSGELYFIPDIVRQSKMFNSPEIDIIPSHITLIDKQESLTKLASSRFRLNTKIQQVHDQYDFVIIDTPPSRDIYAEVTLVAADYLIIPSDLKPFANQGLASVKSFIDEIDETRVSIGKKPLKIMGVLPSKILTNSRYLQYTFSKQKSAVLDHYKLPILESIIFERIALSNCTNKTIEVGNLDFPDPKSIFEFDRQSESAKEFNSLALEIIEKIGD